MVWTQNINLGIVILHVPTYWAAHSSELAISWLGSTPSKIISKLTTCTCTQRVSQSQWFSQQEQSLFHNEIMTDSCYGAFVSPAWLYNDWNTTFVSASHMRHLPLALHKQVVVVVQFTHKGLPLEQSHRVHITLATQTHFVLHSSLSLLHVVHILSPYVCVWIGLGKLWWTFTVLPSPVLCCKHKT